MDVYKVKDKKNTLIQPTNVERNGNGIDLSLLANKSGF
jgi:hypothetical protein